MHLVVCPVVEVRVQLVNHSFVVCAHLRTLGLEGRSEQVRLLGESSRLDVKRFGELKAFELVLWDIKEMCVSGHTHH